MLTAEELQARLEELSRRPRERALRLQSRDGVVTLPQEDNFQPGEMVAIHIHPAHSVSSAPPERLQAGHKHDFIEIAFVWKSECGMEVEGQPFDLGEGDFVILDNNSVHRIFEKDETLLINLDIRTEFFNDAFFRHFERGDALAGFFASTIYSEKAVRRHLVFHTGNDVRIRQLFTMILQEYFAGETYYRGILEELVSILLMTMVRLLRQQAASVTSGEYADDALVSEIMRYMNKNLDAVSRDDIAERFGYSYSHISIVLQSATGLTFSQLKRTLRVQKAELLLRTTDRPIAAVAQDAGFSNMSSFYELFKRTYGATPQDYRKKVKRG